MGWTNPLTTPGVNHQGKSSGISLPKENGGFSPGKIGIYGLKFTDLPGSSEVWPQGIPPCLLPEATSSGTIPFHVILLPSLVGSACSCSCDFNTGPFLRVQAPRGVGPRQECQSKAKTPRIFKSSPVADGQAMNPMNTQPQWVGFRENWQETRDFPMKIMGFSCQFSP